MNEVLKAISDRRSIRNYKQEQVPQEKLDEVIKAAFLAPSARNKQLRHITVIKNQELLDRMAKEINTLLGDRDESYHVFHHAPVVLVLSAEIGANWRAEDMGIISENIALAAVSLGLGTCILGLPQVLFEEKIGEPYIKELQIPDNYQPVLCVTVGIPETPNVAAKERDFSKINYID